MTTIRNGRAYPTSLRIAAIKEYKKSTSPKARAKRTIREVSADYNIHPTTMSTWIRRAGLSQPQPPQLQAYWSAHATNKAFNTPTLIGPTDANGKVIPSAATHLDFRGKRYTI